MGYSTVLFDLDGTLTDSQVGIVSSYQHALALYEIEADEDSIRPWIGPPLYEGLAALGVPSPQIPEAIERYRHYFGRIGILQNRLYEGVADMLVALVEAGVTLGLATSKLERFADQIVDQFEIAGHFKVVAGASLDGSRLSKTDIVASALEGLAWPEPGTVALVGDRADDMRAAVHHGLLPVGAAWGYGDLEELEASGSKVILEQPAAVPALLL